MFWIGQSVVELFTKRHNNKKTTIVVFLFGARERTRSQIICFQQISATPSQLGHTTPCGIAWSDDMVQVSDSQTADLQFSPPRLAEGLNLSPQQPTNNDGIKPSYFVGARERT